MEGITNGLVSNQELHYQPQWFYLNNINTLMQEEITNCFQMLAESNQESCFLSSKKIYQLCFSYVTALYSDLINGQCDLSTTTPPLVLAVLSDKGIDQDMEIERRVVMSAKFQNSGSELVIKHVRNPQELCALLEKTKSQHGRSIDHLTISAHGNMLENFWEDGVMNINTPFPEQCFEALHPKATVSVISCYAGKQQPLDQPSSLTSSLTSWLSSMIPSLFSSPSSSFQYNLAQHIADETKKTVFAPKEATRIAEVEIVKYPNSSLGVKFVGKYFEPGQYHSVGYDFTGIFTPGDTKYKRSHLE